MLISLVMLISLGSSNVLAAPQPDECAYRYQGETNAQKRQRLPQCFVSQAPSESIRKPLKPRPPAAVAVVTAPKPVPAPAPAPSPDPSGPSRHKPIQAHWAGVTGSVRSDGTRSEITGGLSLGSHLLHQNENLFVLGQGHAGYEWGAGDIHAYKAQGEILNGLTTNPKGMGFFGAVGAGFDVQGYEAPRREFKAHRWSLGEFSAETGAMLSVPGTTFSFGARARVGAISDTQLGSGEGLNHAYSAKLRLVTGQWDDPDTYKMFAEVETGVEFATGVSLDASSPFAQGKLALRYGPVEGGLLVSTRAVKPIEGEAQTSNELRASLYAGAAF